MEPTTTEEDGGAGGEGEPAELRCRICLETDVSEVISMFCVASTQKKLLAHMTLAVAGVPISMCDKMPQVICDKCLGNLDVAYACWRRCRESWGDYVRDPALQDKEEDFRCRICLSSNVEELISLYCICDSQLLKINEMVKQYAGVEVKPDDGHPQYTCDGCLSELNIGFDFRKLCRQSNVKLRCELQAKEVGGVLVESDSESLPEAERDNGTPPEPVKVPLKKIAKRRQSVKMRAKPELPADAVRITKLDVPEVVPGRFKKSKKDVPDKVSISFENAKQDVPEVVPGKFKKSKKDVPEVASISFENAKSDVPEVAKKKAFSSPSEFKKLSNQILSKPKELPPVKVYAPAPANKKTSFSSPSEFKQLAKKIMSRKDEVLADPVPAATLVAFEIRVLTDSEHYTHSEISSFKCSRCRTRNPLKTIEITCVKCACAFDNYLLVRPFKGASGMTAYCCTECNYFAKTLTTMVNHLGKHLPAVPVGKPRPMVMKNLVIPIVPISIKEETVEIPEADEEPAPDPLETVFVPGTLKRVNDAVPEPEVQSKKPRKSPSPTTMDVLIELNESESESASDVELTTPLRTEPDTANLFDTLLETTFFKILFLNGILCCGCLKLFPSPDALRQHQTRDHPRSNSTQNEITCKKCNSSCRTVRDVTHHQLLATKRIFYFCKTCPQLLVAEQDFESHRAEDHPSLRVHLLPRTDLLVTKFGVPSIPKPRVIPLKLSSGSPTIFKPLKETAQYRLLLLQGELCCNCKLVLPTPESLEAHLVEAHAKSTSTARFKCPTCSENCRSESKLARHRLVAARRLYYACKLCRGRLLESEDDFEAHRSKSHPRLEVMANGLPLAQAKLLVETARTTNGNASSSGSDG